MKPYPLWVMSRPHICDFITMSVIHDSVAITGPAPTPPVNINSHPYNRIVNVSMAANTFNENIANLITTDLQGCGRVDLVKIEMNFLALAAGDAVMVGVTDINSSIDIVQASQKPNGFVHKATSYNYGNKDVITVVPEDMLSRQLRPVPSDLPSMKLIFEKTGTMRVSFVIYLQVHGIVQTYRSFQ